MPEQERGMAARDVIVTHNDLEWAVETLAMCGYSSGKITTRLRAALESAGLVITAPDAPGTVCIPSDRLTLNDLKQIRRFLWMSYEQGSGEMSRKVGKLIATIEAAEGEPGERGEGDSA